MTGAAPPCWPRPPRRLRRPTRRPPRRPRSRQHRPLPPPRKPPPIVPLRPPSSPAPPLPAPAAPSSAAPPVPAYPLPPRPGSRPTAGTCHRRRATRSPRLHRRRCDGPRLPDWTFTPSIAPRALSLRSFLLGPTQKFFSHDFRQSCRAARGHAKPHPRTRLRDLEARSDSGGRCGPRNVRDMHGKLAELARRPRGQGARHRTDGFQVRCKGARIRASRRAERPAPPSNRSAAAAVAGEDVVGLSRDDVAVGISDRPCTLPLNA